MCLAQYRVRRSYMLRPVLFISLLQTFTVNIKHSIVGRTETPSESLPVKCYTNTRYKYGDLSSDNRTGR